MSPVTAGTARGRASAASLPHSGELSAEDNRLARQFFQQAIHERGERDHLFIRPDDVHRLDGVRKPGLPES
jgi:hypothetical protein